jgi:hypothetical protein
MPGWRSAAGYATVGHMPQQIHPRFIERALAPRYTFAEASRIIHMPSQPLRRRALGHHRVYKDKPAHDEPLIAIDGSAELGALPLSFLTLIELRFLASFRAGASLPAIRARWAMPRNSSK